MDILVNLLAIVVVVLVFNVMIYVHELGHYLAARWRGLHVEKFYIWFGKPLWKKTINGVEYGLGSIPLGGYVALPQMAPMEAIEGGDNEQRKQLPPIKPLDKIIVAFAGPLFSFLLAFTAACLVWVFGKPNDTIHSTVVGYLEADSPAERSGLELGDRIISVDGKEIDRFMGGLDGLAENVMLSQNNSVDLVVERDGERLKKTSTFIVDDTAWYQRRAMRRIGVDYAMTMKVEDVREGSPAAVAGLEAGDKVESIAGSKLYSVPQMADILKENAGEALPLTVIRDGEPLALEVSALVPVDAKTGEKNPDNQPLIGVQFERPFDLSLVYPNPVDQVKEGFLQILATIKALTAKDSNIGIQHLSGPVGIGHAMHSFIRTDEALRRILWFMVIINVNLAIMNLLPLPVLDGGHIVLALGEWGSGRPVHFRVLEIIQTGFVFVLLSLFVYITSKDVADLFPGGQEAEPWGQGGIDWPTLDESGSSGAEEAQ
jgi:regulator of sigma E protease